MEIDMYKGAGRPKSGITLEIDGKFHIITIKHKLYNLRYSLMSRCYNAKPKEYARYQGKGIKVCDSWRLYPIEFYTWAIKNGWKEGLSIDRIDPDKDYEPNNCRFISLIENVKRQRFSKGEDHGLSKLTRENVMDIKNRLKLGQSCGAIARLYNVDRTNISSIKRGKTWSHVIV